MYCEACGGRLGLDLYACTPESERPDTQQASDVLAVNVARCSACGWVQGSSEASAPLDGARVTMQTTFPDGTKGPVNLYEWRDGVLCPVDSDLAEAA